MSYLIIIKKIKITTQALRTRQILTRSTMLPLTSRRILTSRSISSLTILSIKEISTYLRRQSPAYIISIRAIRFLSTRLPSLQRTSTIVIAIVPSSLVTFIFILLNAVLSIQFVTLLKASYTATYQLAQRFSRLAIITRRES